MTGSLKSAPCPDGDKFALIVGASGITGYGLLQNLLHYPNPEYWSSITGLTNRTLSRDAASLPDDERLRLISGLDLTGTAESVAKFFQEVPGIELTTHVYFAAYSVKSCPGLKEIKELNDRLLFNVISAVNTWCPNLQFITLQTGGKYYGLQFPNEVKFITPFKESLPRVPEPLASNIFYYSQIDIMDQQSRGKPWKWADIRPDAIVGFVPHNNAMGVAQALAVFLSVYRHVYGPGAIVPFPGPLSSFKSTHTDTNQGILSRFTIFASLLGNETNGKSFNIGDSNLCVSWESKWSGICAYFGLKGEPPSTTDFSASKWMQSNHAAWADWVEKHDLNRGSFEGTSWDFLESLLAQSGFNREYDLGAARKIGFTEEMDTVKSYHTAFDRYKMARVID